MNVQRVLLDTHILIWMDEDNPRLPKNAKEILENPQIDIFISIASIWEMQLKIAKGKLKLEKGLRRLIDSQVLNNGLQLLPIITEHIYNLEKLPAHHSDPFDRLLIAQAIHEQMAIISIDTEFAKYQIEIIN